MKRKRLPAAPLLPDRCPICGLPLVLPYGPEDAEAIIISNQPGEYEVRHRRPFVPQAPAGRVLHHEFIRAGLSIDEFKMTNVWLHAPNDRCLDWHVEQCLQESVHHNVFLLLGSVATTTILNIHVMAISGLVLTPKHHWSCHFPLGGQLVVAGPNPADILYGTIGECRLAIGRFAQAYKKLKRGRNATDACAI